MDRNLPDETLQDLTGILRLAVEEVRREPIPDQALSQSLVRASAKVIAPVRDRRMLRRSLLGCAAAAATVLLFFRPWIGSPSYSWAEIVQAVQTVPWLHSTSKDPNGLVHELWLSPAHGVSASRWNKHAEYRDHKLRTYWSYKPEESTLYVLPELRDQTRSYFLRLFDTFEGLLRARPTTDSALAYLELGGDGGDRIQLSDETQKSFKDGAGRSWLVYEFKANYPEAVEPLQLSVRVDPNTKLPHLWKIEGTMGKEKLSREIVFDYPEKGPVDVYALGVPRSTKVVDRVPKGDLARFLAGIQAERQRFDAYSGLMVTSEDKEEWWKGRASKVSRKGNRWRVDSPIVNPGNGQIPPADANRTQWWHDRAREVRWFPSMVCDGLTTYWLTMKFTEAPDPRNTTFEVASTKKTSQVGPDDDSIPAAYAYMPEFLAHPPMGIAGQNLEPALDSHPTEGPAGTVLLSVKRVGKRIEGQQPKNLPPAPDQYKFWIDPAKSYVAMRWQMGEGAGGDIFIVEELAKSPNGHWYPTVVRRKNAVRYPNGERHDLMDRFYLDFNAPLPDSLFQQPK